MQKNDKIFARSSREKLQKNIKTDKHKNRETGGENFIGPHCVGPNT